MAISLQAPDIRELKPRITVFGVGGAGGNAVNNMIESGLMGCEFVVANTDAQALTSAKSDRIIQMGVAATEGLGAGSQPDVGRAAAEEVIDEIRDQLSGAHMAFITAGMGGGTGTGAAPVIARTARDMGILTVGVVTKPFQFEGLRRMRVAEAGIAELQAAVDTLIVIPNQNLFRVANEKTTFASAFAMADQVLYSGVACITDLMVKEGLINLDFADVRAIMRGMGKAMMGTGEASGEKRAMRAAEAAIANPLLDDVSMKGARGLLISITGGNDLTLYEVDEAATRIREEVDQDANIILGATFDESLDGIIRVSVVATGIDQSLITSGVELSTTEQRIAEVAERLRAEARARVAAPTPTPPTVPSFRPSVPLEPTGRSTPVMPEALSPVRAEPMQAPAMQAPVMQAPVYHQPAPVREEPVQPRHPMAYEAPVDSVEIEEGAHQAYIPPQAERPVRPTRMPRADEFPPQVQEQLRRQQFAPAEQAPLPAPVAAPPAPAAAPPAAAPQPARGGMTLLQRLATVGFGPRKDEPSSYLPSAAELMAPAPQAPQAPPAPRPAPPVHQEYLRRPPAQPASRPAAGQLDPQGRPPVAQPRQSEDDQLEIPAFLRRQAN